MKKRHGRYEYDRDYWANKSVKALRDPVGFIGDVASNKLVRMVATAALGAVASWLTDAVNAQQQSNNNSKQNGGKKNGNGKC